MSIFIYTIYTLMSSSWRIHPWRAPGGSSVESAVEIGDHWPDHVRTTSCRHRGEHPWRACFVLLLIGGGNPEFWRSLLEEFRHTLELF